MKLITQFLVSLTILVAALSPAAAVQATPLVLGAGIAGPTLKISGADRIRLGNRSSLTVQTSPIQPNQRIRVYMVHSGRSSLVATAISNAAGKATFNVLPTHVVNVFQARLARLPKVKSNLLRVVGMSPTKIMVAWPSSVGCLEHHFTARVLPARGGRTVKLQYFSNETSEWVDESEGSTDSSGQAILAFESSGNGGNYLERIMADAYGSLLAATSASHTIAFSTCTPMQPELLTDNVSGTTLTAGQNFTVDWQLNNFASADWTDGVANVSFEVCDFNMPDCYPDSTGTNSHYQQVVDLSSDGSGSFSWPAESGTWLVRVAIVDGSELGSYDYWVFQVP